MKRFVLLSLFFVFCIGHSFAQVTALNAEHPQDIMMESPEILQNDYMIKYTHVNPQDIMWGKVVWERIDLNEKLNQKLYYPIDTLRVGPDRRSLFDVLMKNIKNGKITEVYADSYFNEPITYSDIERTLSRVDTLEAGLEQINSGEKLSDAYVSKIKISAADIKEFRIKGMWYFDRRLGILKYRVLGIAPASRDVNFLNDETQPLVELFWVWYKGAREVLHKAKVFSEQNAAFYLSFDQVLTTRRFSGSIYKEDNVYNDRSITDYIKDNAYLKLMESGRVKENIRDREEDMWAY